MQLDKHEAAITNVNVRREKHGKERIRTKRCVKA